MPLALRDGEAPEVAGGGEEEGLGEVAVVVVVVPAAFAAQHHHRRGSSTFNFITLLLGRICLAVPLIVQKGIDIPNIQTE